MKAQSAARRHVAICLLAILLTVLQELRYEFFEVQLVALFCLFFSLPTGLCARLEPITNWRQSWPVADVD